MSSAPLKLMSLALFVVAPAAFAQSAAEMTAALGDRSDDPGFNRGADLNGDGVVNVLDIAIWRQHAPKTPRRAAQGGGETIVAEPQDSVADPGATISVMFALQGNVTPVLGYTLDLVIVPDMDATGTVTADAVATNFFDSENIITAGGAVRDALFSVIQEEEAGGVLINTITDDNSTVLAVTDVNDIFAEVVLTLSNDASGSFTIMLDQSSVLADGMAMPIPFDYTAATVTVGGPCLAVVDCADLDENGIRDDNCVWWACDLGACVATDVKFGDMGGQFGLCPPDGTADGNDRFQALNCFANVDPNGMVGDPYPCEDSPPMAFNVDAGGQFGSCAPDGVCDGNDAFAALNAFAGESSCSCPLDGSPMPEVEPVGVGHARVSLQTIETRIRPGQRIDVDVMLDTALPDLRGYQLHVAAGGGLGGNLNLVDIAVHEPTVLSQAMADHASARRDNEALSAPATWSAFNTTTHQMLVGMDQAGVSVEPGYLATFTFEASDDAEGTFHIEVLADIEDRNHRTFLFPTLPHGVITMSAPRPVRVVVR